MSIYLTILVILDRNIASLHVRIRYYTNIFHHFLERLIYNLLSICTGSIYWLLHKHFLFTQTLLSFLRKKSNVYQHNTYQSDKKNTSHEKHLSLLCMKDNFSTPCKTFRNQSNPLTLINPNELTLILI